MALQRMQRERHRMSRGRKESMREACLIGMRCRAHADEGYVLLLRQYFQRGDVAQAAFGCLRQ